MKIWFDLTNSPHVQFFRQMIGELQDEGHEVVITSRNAANTTELLDLYGMDYTIVGKSYGKKLRNKILGNIVRVRDLVKFVKKHNVDAAISQSSFTSAIAGRLAGVPTIYTNDNEHAMGNKISFVCAHKVFVPEFIPVKSVTNLLVSSKKVRQYPGVKEGIYLWGKYSDFKPQEHSTKRIYYRPEPYFAQYYKGKTNVLDDALIELKQDYEIIILPRDDNQRQHFANEKFNGIKVCQRPMTFDEIAADCSLFIGAGGTMTREMAVIGVPTVSIYQDALLDVDRFLISEGLMLHNPNLNASQIREIIRNAQAKPADISLLNKGKEAYNMIKSCLLNLTK